MTGTGINSEFLGWMRRLNSKSQNILRIHVKIVKIHVMKIKKY